LLFAMRFDFRNPELAGTTMAERYETALEIAEWADRLGCVSIAISEHHGSADGYLPSPLPIVAAMAARTTSVHFSIAALIAPFYDPIRLAEDMLVLDNLSKGRVDLIVAGGYVTEEFDMYGVPKKERVARVKEVVSTLRGAFGGEPFEYRGRTVDLTPRPYRTGGIGITMGGSSEAAARRAARIADSFIPSVPEVWDYYREEVQMLGRPDPGESIVGKNRVIALAADAEAGWKEMAPSFLHECNAYGVWQAQEDVASPYRVMENEEELRASGGYVVLTPDQLVQELKESPFAFTMLHPLCGGMPPELAWSSLRLFETEVLPALS
jgi:alkanesulfonate monooxygenase SsuD/methylene tetrahydromethanopterin reductase-like flavin-dependent oxidoreductase (luciferase family)